MSACAAATAHAQSRGMTADVAFRSGDIPERWPGELACYRMRSSACATA